MIDTRVLSCHAPYRCRHAGVCCTSGWPIPVEPDRVALIERAMAEGRLEPARQTRSALSYSADEMSGSPVVLETLDGACVFHDDGDCRCEVHRRLGHEALPLACRQFPRIVVTDPRGVSITLSHVCPTAASLLSGHGQGRVVVNSPEFPPDGEYVGLDARQGLPPALRPDMLMTWAGWWRFEARAVAHLTAAGDPARAMAELSAAVEDVRRWSPGQGTLDTTIDGAFDRCSSTAAARRLPVFEDAVAILRAAVPEDLRPSADQALGQRTAAPAPDVHRTFLAAHAFASWTAHLGEGLRTWLLAIETAHVLAEAGIAVGDVDLVLRHLADPGALTRAWGRSEM